MKDYLKCLNLLSHSVQTSEAWKANGRGAELHRGEQGIPWLCYTPAAPPQPQLLCTEVLPHWFFSGFFSEARIRINPAGVISITTHHGSAAFVPEYGFLHASSLKETYKNNTKKNHKKITQLCTECMCSAKGQCHPNRSFLAPSQLTHCNTLTCITHTL